MFYPATNRYKTSSKLNSAFIRQGATTSQGKLNKTTSVKDFRFYHTKQDCIRSKFVKQDCIRSKFVGFYIQRFL
jgi:hypothetical protein